MGVEKDILKIPAFDGKQEEWTDWRASFEAVMAIKKMKDVIKPNSTRPTGMQKGKHGMITPRRCIPFSSCLQRAPRKEW